MVRLCQPGKVSEASLAGLLVVYLAAVAFVRANPVNVAPHTAHMLNQGVNAAALGLLIAVVAFANIKRGCGGRWTWTWVTLGVLALNLAVRVGSVLNLRATGRDADNYAAKYVRWDTLASTVGMVAVMAEMYYALVPKARFRTTFFLLGLVFVVPLVLALPRFIGGVSPDAADLAECAAACQKSYQAYDGKDHTTRVVAYTVRREGKSTTYVSFAGTENSTDAKIDMNIADTPLRAEWLRPGDPAARAHKGFAGLYALIRDATAAKIPGHTDRVVFTGHSLGGGLATLAALDYANNNADRPVAAYTFGAPQVGDGAFVKLFDARVPLCVRVVNPFDPVPKSLAAQLLHTKGYYAVASLTADSPFTAHSMDTYQLALSRPVWLRTLGIFAPATYVLLAAGGVLAYHLVRARLSGPPA